VSPSAVHNPTAGAALERLTGLIERVTFHSAETGFAVLRVQVQGQRDLATVIGTLPEVRAGEYVEAHGRWNVDPNHGRQFRAEFLKTTQPDTAEGMEKYLGSGLVKGVGPTLAKRLVNKFGTAVFEAIEKTPRQLLRVEGIGKTRLAKITAAWKEQQVVRQIMVFLHAHGVGTGRAFRIYKTYGEDAIQRVTADPYQLARDIRGIGFKTADKIAASLGIARESDLRARAGVEHVLQELTDAGHCAFPQSGLVERAVQMLEIPAPVIESAVEHGIGEGRLVRGQPRDDDDGANGGPLIYLAALDHAERNVALGLVALSRGQHPCPPVDVDKAVAWVETKISFPLAPAQRQAVAMAATSKVMVLTGGPGVGKTTTVNAIVQILRAKQLNVVLCAPTGRAAKRLGEAAGMAASTIHRLLAFDPKGGGFKHNAANPLDGDVFVVDETSMVDVVLANQTILAIPPRAALVLVGDVDQLPPVGPGSVLRDVIDSGAVPVCRLTEVFRQAARSAVVTNAHRINRGQMPSFPEKAAEGEDASLADFYFVEAEEPEVALDAVLRLVKENIPRRFGLHPLDDVQVITPMQRGSLGARNLNVALQSALNPAGPGVERYGWTFRAGDKVMQTANDYDKDVFNGDIGRISRIDSEEQELTVRFEGREVVYDFNELDELTLSYATTVHKSQGSEYPAVIVPVHTQHFPMLQRNLLYTAMTRGKRLVVLVGTKKAISLAVRRTELTRRITTLRERLAAAAGRTIQRTPDAG
jgi:exodeoxyribonuclease V alpha subunit